MIHTVKKLRDALRFIVAFIVNYQRKMRYQVPWQPNDISNRKTNSVIWVVAVFYAHEIRKNRDRNVRVLHTGDKGKICMYVPG